jgi:hypothetical protein
MLLLEGELVNPISLNKFLIFIMSIYIMAMNAMSISRFQQFMPLVGGGRRSMHIHPNIVEDMGVHNTVAMSIRNASNPMPTVHGD